MADRRYTIVLSVALSTAAVATWGVYRAMESARAEARVTTRRVVVAARDLPEGSRLDAGALAVREWPVNAVPASAIESPDGLIDRVVRVPVFAGEAIVPGRLAPLGAGAGIEVKIAPGKRAMSIRINDVAGIAGLVQPNSRVDVLVTLRQDDGQQGRQVAKLFMENMRVLSVGTKVERGTDGAPVNATTATLEVTPQEAERLALATNSGTIQLVLRGFGDPDSARTNGAVTSDVVAAFQPPAPIAAPAPRPAPVRVVRPAPRPSASAPAAPVVTAPPVAPAADTAVVTVYRGDKTSREKFVRNDPKGTP